MSADDQDREKCINRDPEQLAVEFKNLSLTPSTTADIAEEDQRATPEDRSALRNQRKRQYIAARKRRTIDDLQESVLGNKVFLDAVKQICPEVCLEVKEICPEVCPEVTAESSGSHSQANSLLDLSSLFKDISIPSVSNGEEPPLGWKSIPSPLTPDSSRLTAEIAGERVVKGEAKRQQNYRKKLLAKVRDGEIDTEKMERLLEKHGRSQQTQGENTRCDCDNCHADASAEGGFSLLSADRALRKRQQIENFAVLLKQFRDERKQESRRQCEEKEEKEEAKAEAEAGFQYPRSKALSEIVSREAYLAILCRAADNRGHIGSKCLIELDRGLWGRENHGKRVELLRFSPPECTPKHHVVWVRNDCHESTQ